MKAINYYIVVDKIKEPPKKIGGLEELTTQLKCLMEPNKDK